MQRPFFKAFRFADETDEEILESMSATDFDSLELTQNKLNVAEDLALKIKSYMVHVHRQEQRLKEYVRALEYKIAVDETAEIKVLRNRHKRVEKRLKQYEDIFSVVLELLGKTLDLHSELEKKVKTHYRKIFAQRLKQARKDFHLTQAELATKLNLSQRSVGSYEKAENEPSIAMLVRISKELKRPIDWLVGAI